MSGAIMALAGASSGAGGGGGSGNHPNALVWSNIYSRGYGATQILNISGIGGGTATLTTTNSGGGSLFAIHNGISTIYTGGFAVADADTLGWSILNLTTVTVSGTITVSCGAVTVGTFTFVAQGNNFF
jgi:hypothetical protein